MKLFELQQSPTEILYHGSPSNFDSFSNEYLQPGAFGYGNYFTTNEEIAKNYALVRDNPSLFKKINRLLNKSKNIIGYLYKVSVTPGIFLEWDNSFSNQPDIVKNAIQEYVVDVSSNQPLINNIPGGIVIGKEFADKMIKNNISAKSSSRNYYIIFDSRKIHIIEKIDIKV